MTGYCVEGDHEHCPDTADDTGACSCPCHLADQGDTSKARYVVVDDNQYGDEGDEKSRVVMFF